MNNRKINIIFICIAVVFTVIILFLWPMTYKSTVIVDGKAFSVDVADTSMLLERGLSGRATLKDSEGMFFVFNKPDKYGFWMKEMNFPIDIIWIDQNFKIIHIEKSVLPNTYPKIFYPDSPALYVLEISAGQSDLLNIKIGDQVKFAKK